MMEEKGIFFSRRWHYVVLSGKWPGAYLHVGGGVSPARPPGAEACRLLPVTSRRKKKTKRCRVLVGFQIRKRRGVKEVKDTHMQSVCCFN